MSDNVTLRVMVQKINNHFIKNKFLYRDDVQFATLQTISEKLSPNNRTVIKLDFNYLNIVSKGLTYDDFEQFVIYIQEVIQELFSPYGEKFRTLISSDIFEVICRYNNYALMIPTPTSSKYFNGYYEIEQQLDYHYVLKPTTKRQF